MVDHTGSVFVCDVAHAAILLVKGEGEGPHQALIVEYEGKQLLGPHSGVFDSQGQLFFTDPGPFGETSLERPKGSVYVVSGEGSNRILRPLACECLAHPTGIALSGDESCLYVAEMAANRILRGVQRPPGVWHFTVFRQFAGRLGPVAIVVDGTRGLLYVARTEVKEVSNVGVISVMSSEGEVLKDIALTGYPELSGLTMTPDNSALVVTTQDGTVLRVQL